MLSNQQLQFQCDYCMLITQAVQSLRGLMEEVKTLKAEREVIEKTLRDPVADVISKFMTSLKDLGDVDEESISEAHLRTEYGRVQQQVCMCVYYVCTFMRRTTVSHTTYELGKPS